MAAPFFFHRCAQLYDAPGSTCRLNSAPWRDAEPGTDMPIWRGIISARGFMVTGARHPRNVFRPGFCNPYEE